MSASKRPAPTTPSKGKVKHIDCPSCESPKAVIAATNYSELLCFCPACQHVWDCPNPHPYGLLAVVNVSTRYAKWPVFNCPLMAVLGVHRGMVRQFPSFDVNQVLYGARRDAAEHQEADRMQNRA